MNRRSLFAALMAIGGIAPVAADHAVALAFEDGDYLAECKQRLALHEAEVNRQDAVYREQRIKDDREQAIIDTYLTIVMEESERINKSNIQIPVAHYEILNKRNLIDFIPNEAGVRMDAQLSGHVLKVVRA